MNEPSGTIEFNPKRVSQRLTEQTPAILRIDKEKIPVEILDIGVSGFGLHAMVGLDLGNLVELEVTSDGSLDAYICKVVFSSQEGRHFRIGLEIVEQEPEIVIMSPDDEEAQYLNMGE
ncbi:MAG: PilZ domain-containing protein [Magnetococcus sp. THC-1_WYH]